MSKGKQKPESGGEWNVEWLGVETLTPYANNPRKNDATVPYLKNSIQRFGFRVPLVIDKDGVIVTGHTRLKAALELGMERVPCVRADDLTPEQIKAFRLVDNKVQELSGWDFDKMDEELSALENFDMTDFGFSADMDEDFDENDLDSTGKEKPFVVKVTFPSEAMLNRFLGENKIMIEEDFGAVVSVSGGEI